MSIARLLRLSTRVTSQEGVSQFFFKAIIFTLVRCKCARLATALDILRREGIKAFARRVWRRFLKRGSYTLWLEKNGTLREDEKKSILEAIPLFNKKPLISIITPVYDTPLEMLDKMIGSVRGQLYENWELCLADDGSTMSKVHEALKKYAKSDPRIKVEFREKNGGISEASNSALLMASGEYVGLLDHDDELAIDALFEVAKLINEHPDADFIYTDEDKIDEKGARSEPLFKPDWSPDFLRSTMYTSHFSLYRQSLVEQVGRFRSEFDGTQDYDLALRISEITDSIYHIPKVLYHWRKSPTSTASSLSVKSYALDAQKRALESYLERNGLSGKVATTQFPGNWSITYDVKEPKPLVSIVIPTAGKSSKIRGQEVELIVHCIKSVREKTTYKNYEFVVIHNGDLKDDTLSFLQNADDVRLILYTSEPFNLAEKMNLGVDEARGDYVLLLNDDIEVISENWLELMLGDCLLEGVGAVGAKLIFENGSYQHVGVVWTDFGPSHAFIGLPNDMPGPAMMNLLKRNCLAVTGACLLVKRDIYLEVGGFDLSFPLNYNDVDFCMKLREAGYRIVMEPAALLFHYESASKTGTYQKELELLLSRWGEIDDPYYNPNYKRDKPHFEIGIGADDSERVELDYQKWMVSRVASRNRPHETEACDILFSLLTLTWNTPKKYLEDLANSVRQQTYKNFEWVIVDNGSTAETLKLLEQLADTDDRIKLILNKENRGIIKATRQALENATGDYIFTLDHDDLLYYDALDIMARYIAKHPNVDLLYSDEDKYVEDTRAVAPFFKPDWDPVMFHNCCYVAHLSGAKRSLALKQGAYTNADVEGCHDWDMFLRLMRAGAVVVHVPEVLYSWRIHENSTASADTDAKPYTINSQQFTLSKHLELSGQSEKFKIIENHLYGHPGMWRLYRKKIDAPKVTILLVAENGSIEFENTLRSIALETDFPVCSIHVVGNMNRTKEKMIAQITESAKIEKRNIQITVGTGSVVSEIKNVAGSCDFLAIVSDSVVPTEPGWMWEAVGLLEYYDDALFVGGRILNKSGKNVLWAGGHFGFDGFLGSPDCGHLKSDPGYYGNSFLQKSVDGVSPLLWVGQSAFLQNVVELVSQDISLQELSAQMSVIALEKKSRVIYSPFIEAKVVTDKANYRPEGIDSSEDKIWSGPKYHHPVFSRKGDSAFRPLIQPSHKSSVAVSELELQKT